MTKLRRTAIEILEALTAYDARYWHNGGTLLGMDEAGRGPLAGPVVAAAVVMPKDTLIIGINDSKKISEKKREILYDEIMQTAIGVGVGIVNHDVIDEIGILPASRRAFLEAYNTCNIQTDFIISDYITGLDIEGCTPIIKGDMQSYTIAAASIIAKVTRDRIMRDYHEQYEAYNFYSNKGYGTAEHVMALKSQGPCEIHRNSFIGNIMANE